MTKKTTRQRLKSVPVLGYTAELANSSFKLPRKLEEIQASTHDITVDIKNLTTQISHNAGSQEELRSQLKEITDRLHYLNERLAELDHKLAQQKNTISKQPVNGSIQSDRDGQLFADDHGLDAFYVAFENRFRGSESHILEGLREHLPFIKKLEVNLKKKPVIDIGCGRGEFLKLMKELDYKATGIDLNKTMVDRAKEQGYDAIQADAVAWLEAQKPGSIGLITGFHLVEHLPLALLLRLFSASHRALAKGGAVIFETPNPENIIVGSHNFYHDPSHLNPIPPTVLEFELKIRGFEKVDIKRLRPIREKIHHEDELVQEIADRMYGPQDYAAIGYKL